MSRIDDLIAENCPDGVPVKMLGEVGTFIRGNGMQKGDLTDSGFPAIHYGQVHTVYGTYADATVSFVDPAFADRLRKARPGDLVIVTTSEDDMAVAKAVAWLGSTDVAVSGDAYIYRHSLDPKYVAYFFQTASFQAQKRRHVTGTKVRRISGERLAKISIPTPPLEIQHAIVSILDGMEQLEAKLASELQAELEARFRQYAHYRDSLLAFTGERVRWASMSELGTIFGGLTGKSKPDFSDGNARYVSYVNILNHIAVDLSVDDFVQVGPTERQRSLRQGDVLFTGSSETAVDVAISSVITDEVSEPVYLNSFSIGYRLDDPGLLDPDFAKHLFRSKGMRKQLVRTASGVTRFNVSKKRLGTVQVPVPPAAEQRRIASVLDKLDALVQDLSSELPAEIRVRRKQYEHYRNHLLAFEEAVS